MLVHSDYGSGEGNHREGSGRDIDACTGNVGSGHCGNRWSGLTRDRASPTAAGFASSARACEVRRQSEKMSLIATYAIFHQIPLLTADKDFKRMHEAGAELYLVQP